MTKHTGALELAIGGAPVDVTLAGRALPGTAVGPVTITRGRSQVDQRPDAATLSATFDVAQLAALPVIGDQVTVDLSAAAVAHFGTAAGARRRFVGKVTDAQARASAPGQPDLVTIAAVGPRSRFAGLVIGAAPWPAQYVADRATSILNAAKAVDATLVTAVTGGSQMSVRARDVDARPAGDLIDALAVACGGELAELRDGTLRWFDPGARGYADAPLVTLTPADVLAPLPWQQQLGGLLNDATISYGNADSAGKYPAVRVVDPGAAALWPAVQTFTTDLLFVADAQARATELVGRFGRPRWRLPALTVDLTRTLTVAQAAAVLALDFGALLTVTGFPASGPFTVGDLYAEGAVESITRNAWRLQLAVSDRAATGPPPRWTDVNPATSWATAPADLSWLGAIAWRQT